MKSKFISVVTALAIIFSLMPSAFAAETTEPLFNNWTEAAEAAGTADFAATDSTTYTISSAKGLAWFANKVNNSKGQVAFNVILTNDIDLSGVVDDSSLTEENSWIPIGKDSDNAFIGQFDGQGHTISGMKIKSNDEMKLFGLFGLIGNTGTVKNVKIASSQIDLIGTEYNGEDYIPIDHSDGGAIAGENRGTIADCESSANISGTNTGGIAGTNRGTIENCRNSGKIFGYEEVGGISGFTIENYYNNSLPAKISNCHNTGEVTGSFYVGGISGRTSGVFISDCSNSGKIIGQLCTGGISGDAESSSIESCENSGTIEVQYEEYSLLPCCQDIGGIVGEVCNLYGDTWKIQNCHNTGTIICKQPDDIDNHGFGIGGIAGSVVGKGNMLDCVNDGKIDTIGYAVGGLMGRSCGGKNDEIPLTANCVNNGDVNGTTEIGGIAGETTATIVNSYNTGKITATNQDVGGVVGKTSNYSTDLSKGKVINCYNIGEVIANENAGSVVGNIYCGTVENCYYPQGQKASGAGSVTDCAEFDANGLLADNTPLVDKLNENVRKLSNNSWGFWIHSQNPPAVFTADVFMSWTDAGNAAEEGTDYTIDGDTYTVFTPLGLAFIANTVNGGDTLKGKTVLLNNDIDLSGVVNDTDLNDKNSWNPIADYNIKQPANTYKSFRGIFDGQNHIISGLKINRNKAYQGLFGYVTGESEIKNIGIINSSITTKDVPSTGAVQSNGFIAAYNLGNIINCYTGENTSITTDQYTGGIVGMNKGLIDNCRNAAKVSSERGYNGGVCGVNFIHNAIKGGTIKNSSNSGTVYSKKSYAGGIVSLHSPASGDEIMILNCYNEGDITSDTVYAGGIAGGVASSANKYAKILNCYNTGSVTANMSSAGGICGSAHPYDYVINCYNSGSITSKSNAGGIAGRLIGNGTGSNITNCYYLSSSVAKLVGVNTTSYTPTNCSVFGEDGIIVNTNKSLCDVLNDGVHTLNNNDAFTWTKGQGFAEFGEPLSEGLTVEAIKLTKAPASSYIQGQTFNPSGMIITLLYSNGSQADVAYSEENANDFTFTPALDTKLATSDTEITVEYDGQSVFVPITVSEKNVTGINVSSLPDKTTYLEGQELDLTGMTVTAVYDNGESESIGTYDVTGYDKNKVGNQNVTVSCGGFTASFTVTVKAKTVTGIKILSEPTKKEFVEGSTIDVSGLVVQAQYDNDTTAVLTDYTVNGYDKNTVGKQTVTISYSGFDASFEVEVVAKNMIGISLDTSNVKTSLLESESLDARPLIVTAKYDNGTTENIPVQDCKLSGYNRNQTGIQTVTVTYNGFTAQFDVTVAEKTLIGIKILLAPPKVDYIEGEELDTSGLVVWAQYDNGRGKNVLASVKGYDKNKIGTQLVSVEYGGFTAEYTVTVHPKEITNLSITCLPNKTTYLEGEVLDLDGMIVNASYNNGTTEEVINYVVDEFDNNKIGTQEIEVKYGGKVATFTVEVTQKSLSTISITKKPDRTNYIVGQELSLDGMELTAYYNNGTTEVIENYTVTGYDKDKIGPQTVTVGYENYTTTLDVTVVDKSVANIAVMSPPTKTDYIEGQDIELAGLVVTANYDNGTSGNVTGYDIIGYDKNKIGEQVVTVEYAGQTAQFTVNVEAKTLENIMIIRLPFKTEYIEEQELDLTGICVIANYNNGISEEITDYEVSMFDNTAYGMQTIVLTYKDKTATFGLTVAQKQMTKLAITTMPEQITYQKGQELDLTGMTVTAAYDNGKSETVEDYQITGFDKDVAGRQTVVVEYGLMSDSFNIIVAERSLSSITVTPPTKTTYNVGEDLDLAGMTVSKVFDNDETEVITEGYTVTGYDKNQTGTQTITVEYEGCKAEFTVTVLNKSEGIACINSDVRFDTAQNIAEITAAPENCKAGVIIAALYKDNVLVAIKTADYNGTDAPNAISIPYTVQPDTVKVMLWNNIQNMTPLCEAETPTENAE